MPVNGRRYAWESLTIQAPHGIMVDVDSIDYEDERKVNRTYGRGSRTQGWSRGNYSGKGSLSMLREEYERLVASIPGGKYGNQTFPITVSYADEGAPTVTDTLEDCVFINWKTGGKQDDGDIKVTMDFEILGDILDNGRTPFPADNGAGGTAAPVADTGTGDTAEVL